MLSANADAAVYQVPLPLNRNSSSQVFSWKNECRHLFSKHFLNLFFWPLFKLRQRAITHSKIFRLCSGLPGFLNLWKTIQKGSFAYNTLFLGTNPLKKISTNLADITTLALFFGDEFIDGIRLSAGREFIMKLLTEGADKYYMITRINGKYVRLYYSFDLQKLLPENVLQEINPKYRISYKVFYRLLKCFLQEINRELAGLSYEKAKAVAGKIAEACNTCLESYLNDINIIPEQDAQGDILNIFHNHEFKTRYMQKKLLALRCGLADRDDAMYSIQLAGWLEVMSVVQIYDDLQDIVVDDGFQDNMVLCVARNQFPSEWNWFIHNKHLLHSGQHSLCASLFLPSTVQYCLGLAAEKINTMNWEQQKIMHYLLRKNWFTRNSNDHIIFHTKNEVSGIFESVKFKMEHLPEAEIKSYAVDVSFHKNSACRQLLKKVNFSTGYQLKYNLLSMKPEVKAEIFDKIIQ